MNESIVNTVKLQHNQQVLQCSRFVDVFIANGIVPVLLPFQVLECSNVYLRFQRILVPLRMKHRLFCITFARAHRSNENKKEEKKFKKNDTPKT